MKDDRTWIATGSQTVGPFFALGLTANSGLARVAPADAKGDHIQLVILVLDAEAKPMPDSIIELWQADANGRYCHPEGAGGEAAAFHGFGRLPTNAEGECVFETIRPGRVPAPQGGLQAPHINVTVFSRGMLLHLFTRIYFVGDPANREDQVLACVPEDRRATMLAHPDRKQPGTWRFTLRPCGEQETVFFDV
jgi:protocatechuate 3,4-dioxygenase alpha subunit